MLVDDVPTQESLEEACHQGNRCHATQLAHDVKMTTESEVFSLPDILLGHPVKHGFTLYFVG